MHGKRVREFESYGMMTRPPSCIVLQISSSAAVSMSSSVSRSFVAAFRDCMEPTVHRMPQISSARNFKLLISNISPSVENLRDWAASSNDGICVVGRGSDDDGFAEPIFPDE
eukprot:CAMPEP_0119573486 /NCGR_PEP_ID=MMETSP1352-20130426/45148_1 /TAXON_ID=265584 /ORGANISM="Stauroneis constricta, Strain CCMP1120" /LENGTH=111 /DNA_ID=CAMNT_0007623175 /DNA_START=407 /DNA_END=739 /DNA_ORIENTATION=+